MRELTLSELQAKSLSILAEVHSFCEENGIMYYLAYGSLIGAIRHKGFIPWDDDIDIIMPRNDYDLFCKSFSSEKLRIISEHDRDSYITFCRVYDPGDTFVVATNPYHGRKDPGGVWIDIFPIDGAEDSFDLFKKRVNKMYWLWIMQCQERQSKANILAGQTTSKRIKLLLKKIVLVNGMLLRVINRKLVKMATVCKLGTTGHWTQVGCVDDGVRCYQRMEDISTFKYAEFEGYQFRIPIGYDRILKNIYGNYMELPPVEKRVPKESKVLKYYWK
jgi:lipopolysaccharide cholinephosphotransferase